MSLFEALAMVLVPLLVVIHIVGFMSEKAPDNKPVFRGQPA